MNINKIEFNIGNKEKLAELLGIIAGDGHLNFYKSAKRTSYSVEITGNKTEELAYFEFINNLINSLFSIQSKTYVKKDSLCLCVYSKKLVEYINLLGIPIGSKSHCLEIPYWIKKDKKLMNSFIRGIADTDFCICFKKGKRKTNSYPVITGYFSNEEISRHIKEYLYSLGIYCNLYKSFNNFFGTNSIQYRLDINGKKNLGVWMKNIGFNNPKHLTKILVWQKYGYLNPNTNIKQRNNLLKAQNS